jgi:hypothetical protein
VTLKKLQHFLGVHRLEYHNIDWFCARSIDYHRPEEGSSGEGKDG